MALAEGTSFVLLLGVAMPLKYLAGMPLAVRIVGMIHGVLFILYGAMVAGFVLRKAWSWARGAEAMVLSVLPFGTFVLDARLRKDERAEASAPVASASEPAP